MNIRTIMTGIFCGLAFCAFAAEPAPLVVPETPSPKLDGTLDDPAWQNALKIEQLYLLNSDQPAKDTTVYLARDKKWLFLGFKCVNSNMKHVSQTAYNHDGVVQTDDSVEVFIKPETAKKRYYHFILNFANVSHDKRMTETGARDEGWNPPLRSMTKRLPDGWTGEMAIPLFALESDDLGGMQVNICRNFMNIELDPYGAKQSEKLIYNAIKPGNSGSYHDFKNFVAISGLGGFKPEITFAPRIVAAEVTGLRQKDGKYCYDVKLTLETVSAVAGKAKIQVIEDLGTGDVETLSELVDLDGKRDLVLNVPAGDMRERNIRMALVDPADGNLLAAMTIDDTSALSVIKKAFTGRSYFTSEDNASLRLELGLPDTMLKKAILAIDVNGQKASETAGLQAVMTPGVPTRNLRIGDNQITLRIMLDGKELASKTLNAVRLEPRPGFEVKTDLIKGVMLKDDKPIFPVGMIAHSLGMGVQYCGVEDGEEGVFKFLSEIGFNTLMRSTYKDEDMFTKLAGKYGMNVITWSMPNPLYLAGTNAFVGWDRWYRFRQANKVEDLPLAEKLVIQKKWYEKLEPELIRETKLLREHTNMLGYYNVDEPNLWNADERIAAAEWYWNTVKGIDPYRPLYLLYSMNIPYGDNWTRWGQVLGYDIYPRPFMGGIFGESGLYTAYYACELRERCRRDNKVMFFVPLANMLDPGRSPVGMSKAHMLCQAYVSVIYGVRGLFYFCLSNVVGEDAWDALRTICAQIKELTPALGNGDIAQNIRYTPDNYRPRERKFPMVNAAIYKYPDGDYLLLAANIVPFAVDTKFNIGGMKKSSRLFGDKGKVKLKGESFTDKIEPYGVRAYKIKLADNPEPVQVALDMTALEDEKAPSVDVPGIIRQVTLGKNHVPNPCFKQQFNKGIPDFYKPYFNLGTDPDAGKKGSTWYVDNETLWNGNPSLRMFRAASAKKGVNYGNEKTRGTWGVSYRPASDKPGKMTFSFYAKGDKAGVSIWVRVLGQDKTLPPLTTEWQRYSITGNADDGSFLLCPPAGVATWINGLKMEEGETPTEFQDDSVIEKKKTI